MFSTGEVCIVSPTPITSIDPDAASLAELELGSNLLDLDLVQDQQRHRMGDTSSPSVFSFGFPPAPEMQGLSFYQDQHPAPQAMMGPPMFQQGGFGNMLSEIDESEMARLLMREMIPDIVADCQMLNIHPNLYTWSPEDVQRWIECITRRYELGDVNPMLFCMSGAALASMRDEEFRERVPKCGDILFSIVYILKSAAGVNIDQHQVQVVPQGPFVPNVPAPVVPTTQSMVPPTYDTHHMAPAPVSPNAMHKDYDSGSTGSPSDDEVSIPSSPAPSGPNTSMTPNHTGGIQLWQFLKELLLQPNSYSYCIRWLDRPQGIFKIEDSVEVARLWGLRKNRPAMNYDKLSRSIRQYYRKGIMKKTEVSQRLVYQFVHPC